MAQLSSPGVSVTVIDESFYTPAAPGTVPLIVVASQENKQNAAGTGTAPGTLKANAGKAYLITSQMELGSTFGIPFFQTDASNNPVHAGEVNEYGLQAAYSFLGVSNRAYVVRADLDTSQLLATAIEPTGEPANGTIWFDTSNTSFGLFQWNSEPATTTGGQTFTNKAVTVITSTAQCVGNTTGTAPLASVGQVGDYAIVATSTLNKLWMKKYLTDTAAGTWVEVGSEAWKASWPAAIGTFSSIGLSETFIIEDTNENTLAEITGVTTLAGLVEAINEDVGLQAAGITASSVNSKLNLYSTGIDFVLSGSAVTLLKTGLAPNTYTAPALQLSPHYTIPTYKRTANTGTAYGYPSGSLWVKTTNVNRGADWVIKKYNQPTHTWIEQPASVYENNASALAVLDPTGGGINLTLQTAYVKYNDDGASPSLANFKIYGRSGVGVTSIVSSAITSSTFTAGTNTFTVQASQVGTGTLTSVATVSFTAAGATGDSATLLAAFSAAVTNPNIVATLNSNNSITIKHLAGGDLYFVDGTALPLGELFSTASTANFYPSSNGLANNYTATLWSPYTPGTTTAFAPASATAPTTRPADGTLWFNSVVDEVDILVHNGDTWVGLQHPSSPFYGSTNANGPFVSATAPTGTLIEGDIWIDTSEFDTYPHIYKYNVFGKWVLVNNADQTTEDGILFADARWNTDGQAAEPSSIASLLVSDFLDFDAPDPALYPTGMLLWNLRRSGNNVLKYVANYVDVNDRNLRQTSEIPAGEPMTAYYPDRWVSNAANQIDGSGSFGRKAQRAVVLQALTALINENQQIRDEDSRQFNLLACPGYLETLSALIDLNTSRGETAFIVADTPARLTSDATSLSNWGQNVNLAAIDGENGLIATNSYAAVYYPWGYTTDLLGNNIVVPPSHIMLRTIALSDNVSYPWFAPAGVRRGGVTNASSVGYVDAQSGEFITVALNTGQRDTLAGVHVNPITYIAGTGLVAYGQKTRQLIASSLDRINVARLVIYLRYQLNQIAKPFVFEPNDTITRNEIKQQIEKMLLELTGQRALYDYIVVCDGSNNTPARIDANELHVDIAIEPVKAVEFIYIPMRLENTGAIKGL